MFSRKFSIKSNKILNEKLLESSKSVLPVAIIVFILCVTLIPIPNSILMSFLVGTFMLILGMSFFTLGTDTAMIQMGETVGSSSVRTRKLWFILGISFIVGVIITISEPDLQILANQTPDIPTYILIISVGTGVGLFLLIAMLRIFFHIPLRWMLLFFYAVIFVLLIFAPSNFIPVAFDSGGVTTGPMTVPFIMALGMGIAATRSDKSAEEDSFGLVALCSVGPIITVLILGLLFKSENSGGYVAPVLPDASDSRQMWMLFVKGIPHYLKEVAVAVLPIVVFFGLFQIFRLKLRKGELLKIGVGLIYTYVGLVLFLTGANIGFMPVGSYIGTLLGELEYNWITIPIGALIGYFIVAAEPAVHVLNRQVQEITAGAIPKKALSISLSFGIAISVGLSIIRILTDWSILYFIIPGYIIAFVLSFFVPPIFTAIAFDSGGVASGPMTATFLLPLGIGFCSAIGGNISQNAFGTVAMVAMTPLITIQLLGVYFKIKTKNTKSTGNNDDEQ